MMVVPQWRERDIILFFPLNTHRREKDSIVVQRRERERERLQCIFGRKRRRAEEGRRGSEEAASSSCFSTSSSSATISLPSIFPQRERERVLIGGGEREREKERGILLVLVLPLDSLPNLFPFQDILSWGWVPGLWRLHVSWQKLLTCGFGLGGCGFASCLLMSPPPSMCSFFYFQFQLDLRMIWGKGEHSYVPWFLVCYSFSVYAVLWFRICFA